MRSALQKKLAEILRESGVDPSTFDLPREGVATILVIRLADTSSLSRAATPEPVHEALGVFYRTVCEAAHRLGGSADDGLGPFVQAAFGGPFAKGGPAEALEAARSIAAALRDCSSEGSDAGEALQIAAGIATGCCRSGQFGDGQRLFCMLAGAALLRAVGLAV